MHPVGILKGARLERWHDDVEEGKAKGHQQALHIMALERLTRVISLGTVLVAAPHTIRRPTESDSLQHDSQQYMNSSNLQRMVYSCVTRCFKSRR